MFRIGLTGGIGSGKSTIAKILESKGFPVFYSDEEAKSIVHSDLEVKQEIISLLGEQSYIHDVYNREYIASKVFNDKNLLESLNMIIHPAVRDAFERFSKNRKESLVFNEAAILIETGSYTSFDYTILVCSPVELRLERIMSRDKATKQEVEARMRKQWDDDKKRALANFVIENNEEDSILFQVDKVIQKLISLLH